MSTVLIVSGRSFNLLRSRMPLMKLMRDEGFRVICSAAEQPELTPAITKPGIEFVNLPIPRSPLNPFKSFRAARTLSQLVKSCRPDLVHVFNPMPILLGGGFKKLFRHDVPIVATFTGLGFERNRTFGTRAKIVAYKRSLRYIDAVTFENFDDQRFARETGMIDSQPSVVSVSSGVDLDFFSPPTRQRDEQASLKFLFASRLLWSKGIAELAEAVALLKKRHGDSFSLTLAGELESGHADRISENYIRQKQRQGIWEFVGPCSLSEMPALYQQADVAVLPSYREGLSRVLMEAAAMSMPLIASDIPGCREVIRPNENGRLNKPRDVASLVDAMEFFIENRDQVEQYGRRSRDIVEAEFCDQVLAARTMDFYRNLNLIS